MSAFPTAMRAGKLIHRHVSNGALHTTLEEKASIPTTGESHTSIRARGSARSSLLIDPQLVKAQASPTPFFPPLCPFFRVSKPVFRARSSPSQSPIRRLPGAKVSPTMPEVKQASQLGSFALRQTLQAFNSFDSRLLDRVKRLQAPHHLSSRDIVSRA